MKSILLQVSRPLVPDGKQCLSLVLVFWLLSRTDWGQPRYYRRRQTKSHEVLFTPSLPITKGPRSGSQRNNWTREAPSASRFSTDIPCGVRLEKTLGECFTLESRFVSELSANSIYLTLAMIKPALSLLFVALGPTLSAQARIGLSYTPSAIARSYPLAHLFSTSNFVGTTTAMSSQTPQQDTDDSKSSAPLPLPAPPTEEEKKQILDLSNPEGSTVRLDSLGPMVVNVDGTLSRISNWDAMSEIEQKNTLRVLGKRNKQRLEALKSREAEEETKKAEL